MSHSHNMRSMARHAGSAHTKLDQGGVRPPQVPTVDVQATAVQPVMNSADFPDSVRHLDLRYLLCTPILKVE